MAKPKTNQAGRGIVIHKCANEPEGVMESYAEKHGWNIKELPLNSDHHKVCPYCKEPTSDMENAPGEQAIKLEKNLRARGTSQGPVATTKAENAALMQAIQSLREEVAALRKKKGGSD